LHGSFMHFAYASASSKPVRKVYYPTTITGLSVAVALLIGTVELLSIAADRLHLTGGLWDWVSGVDLNTLGFGIVGLFAVVWVIALLVWKLGRVEQRWTAGGE